MLRTPEASARRAPLQRVLPDGCMDIILACGGTERDGRDALSLTAVGAMTRYLDAVALPLRLGVRFQPGMGSLFLRVPAPALTDSEVPLAELWGDGGRRLLDELVDSPSLPRRIRTLERCLLRRLDSASAADGPVQAIVGHIVAQRGQGAVGGLLRACGRSERHVRRRFEAAVGLSPKHLARIVRLEHALRAGLAADPGSWARIAVEAGYYDQAHLIAECRALAGRTPAQHLAPRP
jgi:AraC-like DNA-binding protein